MRKIIWIVVILLVAAGVWFWMGNKEAAPAAETQQPGPSQAAGINGSPNQGNLGQPATGVVQQPLADGAEGSIIGANVALGTDSNDKLGSYLIGYNGMTVYTFSKDQGAVSSCYDACAKNWPPYLVGPEDNIKQLKSGVNGTVGTTVRTDGSLQLTYNGHPLYFYIKDTTSGDASGDGVNNVWAVVKP